MKLIIAGSRSIKEYSSLREALVSSGLWKEYRNSLEIVCGMAQGVDMLGKQLADGNSLTLHRFHADWKNLDAPGAIIRKNKYGKYNVKAGLDRNIDMGEFADGLLALWDGESKGTKQMIDWMIAHNKYVYYENFKTGEIYRNEHGGTK